MHPETQLTQEIGAQVEDFTLPGVNGGRFSLSASLEGKKGAVVVFWSGVCSHCVRYDEYLSAFSKNHPELALIAIASRHGETQEQLRTTMTERGLRFPLFYDEGSVIARRWAAQQTPRTYLLGPDRTLYYRGAIDNFKYPGDAEFIPHLETAISEFLAGKPVCRNETASFGCAVYSVYYTLPKHF